MQVLIVDDDDFALHVLENMLARMGYTSITAHDGKEAMEILRGGDIRLVITDWEMPVMTGIELCRAVRGEDLSAYVYVIMLTGREGPRQHIEGLCNGADDFLKKPLDPEELFICLKTAERILSLETRDLALFALAKLSESRDSDTGAHVERVQSYSRLIAKNLSPEVKACHGVDDEFIRRLFQTSPLHDLGKVGIPDAVLLKPAKLTPAEFAIMETHTVVGAQTLDAALERFPNARFLQMARQIALSHHEHFDGSGYPHGLAGDQIPLAARIVAVADVYDALTNRRVYKEAMSHESARAILLNGRGSHFDPECVDAFLRAEPQVLAIHEQLMEIPPPQSSRVVIPAQNIPAPSDPCKILVVEDDPLVREYLVEILAATGELVFSANDGREGLALFNEHQPRVVVSDWMMPEMDGVELCGKIRANATSTAHFIMLTAHSDKSELLKAYQAGVDDFISKPFDQEELLARVRAGIRNGKLHDDLMRKASGSQALNAQLATVNSRLERLSITDELTGLFNRRHAMSRLEEQWSIAERHGKPLTIAMIDIDHFKKVNDTLGHIAGDAVLRQVAKILREQTRANDPVCRVGGEEFLIILAMQTWAEARIAAERCREAVEKFEFEAGGTKLKVTISIGIATRLPTMEQVNDLLKASDAQLYIAKNAGRNNVQLPADLSAAEIPPTSPVVTPVSALNTTPVPPIDMPSIVKRCGGDPKFAASVVDRFRAQSVGEVAKIEQLHAAGDAQALTRAAHSMKSMAAYVSADAVSSLAQKIEALSRDGKLIEASPLVTQLRDEINKAEMWLAQNAKAA
jgi:putative two-component system response regulator